MTTRHGLTQRLRQRLRPRAEPLAWGNIAALIVASLISYGVPITDPLAELMVVVLPFLLVNGVARFVVYAPDTVAEIVAEDDSG